MHNYKLRNWFIAIAVGTLYGSHLAPAAELALTGSLPRAVDPRLAPMRLHTEGIKLLNSGGEQVRLRGVNIASLEWSTQGEHMQEAFECAIQRWKANLIRVPLAQDRWFGKTTGQRDGGASYRALVDKLTDTAAASGVYMLVDLHWSDCGKWAIDGGKLSQHLMPDEHSVLFWRDVASRYQHQPNVMLGLYNEPHDIPWAVWHNGGPVTEKPSRKETNQPPIIYEAVGMQRLYDTVRAVGAENIVTVSGNDWGYDLRGVLQGHAITGTNLIYESHPYSFKKDWDGSFGEVSKRYPVLLGEWGGRAADLDYGRRLMDYADQRGLHWTAWCFHPTCGPALLRNWSFEPNEFGMFVRDRLTGGNK